MHDTLGRIDAILKVVAGDNKAKSLIAETLDCANRYVQAVNAAERGMKNARFRLETNEYQKFVVQLDQRRRVAHDALISQLNVTNRYLMKNFEGDMPVGGLYSGDPHRYHDRIAIADWAFELIKEIAEREQIEKEKEQKPIKPGKIR